MQQLIDTYSQLMTSLAALPDEIAGYQKDLTSAKLQQADIKKQLDSAEADIISANGGWKALGSNEKERELALPTLFRSVARHVALTAEASKLQRTIAEMADELAAAERQYGAVCYMARLHSALMTYLGNAGAPAGNVALPANGFITDFNGVRHSGINGAATVADAAELGL